MVTMIEYGGGCNTYAGLSTDPTQPRWRLEEN